MELEEARKICKTLIDNTVFAKLSLAEKYTEKDLEQAIDIVLKEIDKKDKVINLMAEDRAEISEPATSKEAIINYYFKKAEEEML